MQVKESRGKFLPHIIITGFILNFVFGLCGALSPNNSVLQIIFWQGAMTCMISACALMGSFVADKGWPLASGAYILLSIAHASFYASLVLNAYHPEVMASGIIILIPSFIFIGLSNYFPPLLKWLSIMVCLPFLVLYVRILSGVYMYNEFIENFSFTYLEIIGVLWGIYIWRELKINKEVDSIKLNDHTDARKNSA